jgi:hypothetical protein
MPRLRSLSGPDVEAILRHFGFTLGFGDSRSHGAFRATHDHDNGQLPRGSTAHNPLTVQEIVPNRPTAPIFRRVHSITKIHSYLIVFLSSGPALLPAAIDQAAARFLLGGSSI